MGKYMRKAKASGEVAVMEVPGGALLGVRTRSRTLALQRAQQRPPPEKGETAEYLELRSRKLEKPPHPKEVAAPSKRSAGKKGPPMAEAEAAAPAEDAVEVSYGENVPDFDAMERNTRETTPCSLIRNPEAVRTPGSTTKSKASVSVTSHRRIEASLFRFVPTSVEMEEFFAASEQQAQHSFRERYNFCPVNDCPLPGRYEWVGLDC